MPPVSDKIDFLFVIHNHQPVGNFDFVIENTYWDSYEPFISALEKYPGIRAALHYSGFLWEYLCQKHPEFVARIKKLVERGQVEMLGGAYYEAILPVLFERDAEIQLRRYRAEMKKFTGQDISGMWLAERIWEPCLPTILKRGGYDYTFIDEYHFQSAGLKSQDIWGYYESEDRGERVTIFPIDKTLRYMIPFHLEAEVFAELEQRRQQGVRLITYGDDGEKFGGWPGTKKWVYDDGWLERFLTALENCSTVRMLLPREAVKEHFPLGDIYFPCASYEEMGEWTQPAERQVNLAHLKEKLGKMGLKEEIVPLLRGGFWRQYFSKYPESARLYQRSLRVSDKVALLEEKNHRSAKLARQHLMKGQANDAYWHGVFGGVYLPHLRFAVEKELIIAEAICDNTLESLDLKDKYQPRALNIGNQAMRCSVLPHLGGGISTMDIRSAGLNLLDTITRRIEPYHTRMLEAVEADDGSHKSIHERLEFKEKNLAEKLAIDGYQRLGFIDHFLKPDFTIEELQYKDLAEAGDFTRGRYSVVSHNKLVVKMQLSGEVAGRNIALTKSIILHKSELRLGVSYKMAGCENALGAYWFAPELTVNLLAPEAPDRFFLHRDEPFPGNNLGSRGDIPAGDLLSLVDDYLGVRVNLITEPRCRWVWYPVETISLSEGGIERVYQGSAILPMWRLKDLHKGEAKVNLWVESWKPAL